MKNILDAILAVLTLLIPRLKKPDSQHGIKETKEALVALNEISLFFALQFKDGVQIQDFSALYDKIVKDPTFQAKVLLAYENYAQIPMEIKDIDAGEGLEIVKVQTEYAQLYIDLFKKV
jgi:hypothetical protein